jgi:intracellular multiplication protein IcmC
MVNTIVDHQKKLNDYLAFARTLIIVLGLLIFLSGCSVSPGGARQTLAKFDERAYRPLMETVGAVGWMLGLGLIVMGVFKLKAYGQMRTMMSSNVNLAGPLMLLLTGTVLLYLPTFTRVSLYSVWGSSSPFNPPPGESDRWLAYFQPISHLMTLIGYIAFIRGWILLSKVGREGGHQQGIVSKGLMHILGGLLSINFMGTINILKNSLT